MKSIGKTFFCVVLAGAMGSLCQAEPVSIEVKSEGVIGAPSGSGKYPAVAVADASMPMNTLYLPAELPGQPLPLIIWGTGGCFDNGLGYSQFLKEVASHGFLVISGGHPRFERPIEPPGTEREEPRSPELEALDDTTVDQLLAAIDWAGTQNADPDSPYHGRIDMERIGAMGHSCGGLQAISLLTDPRVDTAIAFNSGVLTEPPPGHMAGNVNLVVEKSALEKLNGPIAYINGGPDDVAYKNALDDLERIGHVPVFFGENGVGHGGTFHFDEHGGEYAGVAVAWMNWQLRRDELAARWFDGDNCVLCTREGWQVRTKGLE